MVVLEVSLTNGNKEQQSLELDLLFLVLKWEVTVSASLIAVDLKAALLL